MEKEIRNDLNIEYVEDGIEVEVRFRNVTWEQSLTIFNDITAKVKSFTWE